MQLSRFPCENGTVADLVKIADISRLCETQLIYYIVIPLADYHEYDLYKTSPFPIPQATANGTTTYAFFWPNSPFFALSWSQDTYITIQAENLNKCKKINELYICRGMDPERILDEHAGWEIRSATKQQIRDLGLCDIRMIKSSITFWTRTRSPNTWAFSAGKKDKLLINCARTADQVVSQGESVASG